MNIDIIQVNCIQIYQGHILTWIYGSGFPRKGDLECGLSSPDEGTLGAAKLSSGLRFSDTCILDLEAEINSGLPEPQLPRFRLSVFQCNGNYGMEQVFRGEQTEPEPHRQGVLPDTSLNKHVPLNNCVLRHLRKNQTPEVLT